jgi:F-type H+-transporting ATPase subunit a
MHRTPLVTHTLFHLGPVPITSTVVTTWIVMAAMVIPCWLGTRRLQLRPGKWQSTLELVVTSIEGQIRQVVRREPKPFVPLIGTLFLFLVVANLSAMIPGTSPPTAHLETDAALAGIVFLSVHVFGIRQHGLWGYLKGYGRPSVLLLPLNILSEVTRTFSLMIRLFGNIMSHEIVIGVVVALAGLLVPIPLMVLAVLIGIVQAYIFAILATVFIGAAVETHEAKVRKSS